MLRLGSLLGCLVVGVGLSSCHTESAPTSGSVGSATKPAADRVTETAAIQAEAKAAVATAPVASEVPDPPQMVILVDDVGFRRDRLARFLALPLALSFAVIPGTPHDRSSAELIRQTGHDLLVHQPMEPEGYPQVDPGPCALLTTMSEPQIVATLDQCAGALRAAIGMNNHMGSAFTASLRGMRVVAGWLAVRQMFFVDSLTTPDSQAKIALGAANVPSFVRDVFADNVRDEEAIQERLEKARTIARHRGKALLLCHPHEVTIKVLASWVLGNRFAPVVVVPVHTWLTGRK